MSLAEKDVVPFPEKVRISCFTKKRGALTKIIRIDPETKQVVKDGTECSMFSGTSRIIPISSPAGFARMIRTRNTNQAIAHGISEYDEATIVTKSKVPSNISPDNPVISRTKDFFSYPDGPGVLLFDHDKARTGSVGSEDALQAYRPDELINLLATVHPELKDASYVSTPSTSSCIYDAEGKELRGEGTGSHTYLFVKNAKDIPRYLETLGRRLFLAGLGRIEISRSGALLPRTLVDLVVGSPERLDFVAGAVCEDGLIQKLPDPSVKNGEMLDTSELFDLTPAEEEEHKNAVDALKEAARPGQEKVIAEYFEKESVKLAAEIGISVDEAKAVIVSRQDHILADDDILYFSHLKNGSKVADVLKDGAAYHGKSLADPLEPDYEGGSKTKAKFYWNDGNPFINSFAHGEGKYRFKRFVNEEVDKKNSELLSQEQQMFDRFVFLASDNKIIDTMGHDIKESMMVKDAFQISQAGGWHYYQDENGNDKKMPLAKWWLMSEDKKIAAAIRYYPGKEMLFENGDGRTYFNSFRFPYSRCPVMDIKEREKRLYHWSQIMDTVFHIHREYIEDWLAYTIQQPEKRTQIMPVCMSDQGLGKSLIMAILSRVVGSHNFSNGRIQEVTGLSKTGAKWGDWIYNTKISCIEEMDPEGESGIRFKIYDAMKDIITNETLSLNLKGGKNGTFSVYSSIMGFSNYRDCVKIPFGDRRMYIVDSLERTLLSFEEYKKIWEWMADAKNIVAVFQYLLLREISADFIPGQAKSTPEKVRLQQDGRSIVQSAFDLVIKHYPCDLITSGELQLAVNEAIQYIQGEESEFKNMNADKQYAAIVRSVTSPVAGGKKIRVRREGGQKIEAQVRAIRNITEWVNSDNLRIKEGFLVPIPSKWIVEEKEEEFTKF